MMCATSAIRFGRAAAHVLRRFRRDRRGIAATEFALTLPVMLTMYLGTVELSQGINAGRKVTQTARTVADLVSRVQTMNTAQMTNSFNAGVAVMAPYDAANLKMTVTSVSINSTGAVTVVWKKPFNGGVTSPLSVPAALLVPDSSLILAEVQYDYTPVVGYVLSGTFNLNDKMYMRPRLSKEVEWN